MSHGDEMDCNTRVPIARRMWMLVVMSCLIWHYIVSLPKNLDS
jgi:hypothetical protein